MATTISATKVRENFADVLNRVSYAGEEFVVERQGKPTALIINVEGEKVVATECDCGKERE